MRIDERRTPDAARIARRPLLSAMAALSVLAAGSALFAAACAGASPVKPRTPNPTEGATSMTTDTVKPAEPAKAKRRVLIATTSHDKKGATGEPTGAYLSEVAHPYEVFVRAGYDVDVASVRGGKVPLDGVDRSDAGNARFLDDPTAMGKLEASLASRAVDASKYDAVFFAGGHGAMWDLPNDEGFHVVARRIYEAGGVVSAVCHGPAALVDVKLSDGSYLVAGKTVSGFTDEEERAVKLDEVVPFLLEARLRARGGRFVGAKMWAPQVSSDARLVTGQNPASAGPVAEAVVAALEGRAAR